MAKNLRVTVFDPETGETVTREVGPADYAIVITEPLHLDALAVYGNGTKVLTLKIRK